MQARFCIPLLFLTVAGCGSSEIDAEGRVYFGDAPVVPAPGQTVRVILKPRDNVDEAAAEHWSNLDGSGLFRFSALTPGRYVVTVCDYPGPQRGDRLANAFARAPDSIVLDVDGAGPLEVRLPHDWAPK